MNKVYHELLHDGKDIRVWQNENSDFARTWFMIQKNRSKMSCLLSSFFRTRGPTSVEKSACPDQWRGKGFNTGVIGVLSGE